MTRHIGPGWPYQTVQDALDDGAVVLAWGHVSLFVVDYLLLAFKNPTSLFVRNRSSSVYWQFIDRTVNFFILGVILFLVAQAYQLVSKDKCVTFSCSWVCWSGVLLTSLLGPHLVSSTVSSSTLCTALTVGKRSAIK